MSLIKTYKPIFLDIIKLALPILGGNIAQILISFSDTIVAGRYSTVALGAISVASAIVMTIIIGAIGLILSISPVISNFRGEKTPSKKYFKLTILFSIFVSIPFFLIIELFLKYIDLINLSPDMLLDIKNYISICAYSIFPVAIFTAVKEFLQAFEKVKFANFLMIFMVVLNFILNIILTFGYGSIPAMGVIGLSIATLASRSVIAILILIYCIPFFKRKYEFSKKYISNLLKIGTPISLAMFFEFFGFNLTAILIGKFSSLYAAVHNIILCLANFTFMVVLSVANAVSVKIGFFNGAGDKKNIIKYSIANIVLVLLICFSTFTILGIWHNQIISIFSKDVEVLNLSKQVLKIAMAFLFFDGIQGACVGILKGLKDTKIVMFTMFFAYLIVAIPLGCYLAYSKNIILQGFWIGLALALMSAAIITGCRVLYRIKKIKD